jgi:hypothetical protein
VLLEGLPVQRAEGTWDGSCRRLLLRSRLSLRGLHVRLWHELRVRRAGRVVTTTLKMQQRHAVSDGVPLFDDAGT